MGQICIFIYGLIIHLHIQSLGSVEPGARVHTLLTRDLRQTGKFLSALVT